MTTPPQHTTIDAPSIVPDSGMPELSSDAPRFPALQLDINAYDAFVADADLSEAQRRELLTALWEIIVGFVDLGFGLHPIQHVIHDTKIVETDSTSVLGSKDISEQSIEVAALFSEHAGSSDS